MKGKARHPYAGLPGTSFWGKSVAEVAPGAIDPVVDMPFRVSADDKVATAGSCFAQHIARHLQQAGFNHFVSEAEHPILSPGLAESFGYGVFSARYGNVYTARQLLQLMQRAHGEFSPRENAWEDADGRWRDPFRPRVEPAGFRSRRELELDRKQHLAAVRRMFAELDVLVFTLGLTEAWLSKEDGAVFPLCPGTAGGTFDEQRHAFHNFSAAETRADLLEALDRLRAINPASRVILTVSPVPLVATADRQHVLAATAYSKSVLRVAADEVCRQRDRVAYFPAYEIITGSYSRGRYFADDLRSVTEEGVSHVMRVFFRHCAGARPDRAPPARTSVAGAHAASMEALIAVNCDEEVLAAASDGQQ